MGLMLVVLVAALAVTALGIAVLAARNGLVVDDQSVQELRERTSQR